MIEFQNIRITWDKNKNASNLQKHGIRFEEAYAVFLDERRIERVDTTSEHEERWRTIGITKGAVLLLVVHTLNENGTQYIRIISARRATKSEEEQYYDNCNLLHT